MSVVEGRVVLVAGGTGDQDDAALDDAHAHLL